MESIDYRFVDKTGENNYESIGELKEKIFSLFSENFIDDSIKKSFDKFLLGNDLSLKEIVDIYFLLDSEVFEYNFITKKKFKDLIKNKLSGKFSIDSFVGYPRKLYLKFNKAENLEINIIPFRDFKNSFFIVDDYGRYINFYDENGLYIDMKDCLSIKLNTYGRYSNFDIILKDGEVKTYILNDISSKNKSLDFHLESEPIYIKLNPLKKAVFSEVFST